MRKAFWCLMIMAATGYVFGGLGLAFGADLSVKAKPLDVPVITTSPFYVGVLGGGGFSSVESDLTFSGVSTGPIKAFPTGVLAGGEAGARWNTGTLGFGVNITALYDFSHASVGGNAIMPEVGSSKNGLLLMEGASVGINLSTLFGYIPGSAQPTNWPIPITVPSSVMGNLSANAIGGLAQRWQTLCAFDAMTGTDDICGSRVLDGWYIGGELTAMLSAQVEAKVKIAHIFWNGSFTPLQAIPVFQATTSAKDETIGLVGIDFHF